MDSVDGKATGITVQHHATNTVSYTFQIKLMFERIIFIKMPWKRIVKFLKWDEHDSVGSGFVNTIGLGCPFFNHWLLCSEFPKLDFFIFFNITFGYLLKLFSLSLCISNHPLHKFFYISLEVQIHHSCLFVKTKVWQCRLRLFFFTLSTFITFITLRKWLKF